MLIVSAVAAPGLGVIDQPLWQLQQAAVFWRTLATVLLIVAAMTVSFALLGGLLMRSALASGMVRAKAVALAMLAVSVIAVLCAMLKDGWLPSVWPLYLLVALPSALFGCLLAGMIARTHRPLFGFFLLSAAFGLLAAMLLVLLTTTVLQRDPLPIEGTTVASADRVRLTTTLRAGSPRHLDADATKTLILSANDINQLAAWGLSLGSGHRYLYVTLGSDTVNAAASLQWAPRLLREPVYLNVSARAQPSIRDGRLQSGIETVRVGALPVPAVLANWLAHGVFDLIAADPRFANAIGQLKQVQIENKQLVATYGAMDLPTGFRAQMFGELGDMDIVAVAFSEHMHLQSRLAETLEAGITPREQALSSIVAASFDLANRRHRRFSSDPALENRLAIIALGLTLGHRKIAEVVPGLPPGFNKVPQLWRQAPLLNRTDWTRHFWVSAALTVLSDQTISVDLGYLKEELDAGADGGSGFSFADLGADLAGVAFARALITDRRSAKRLQQQLTEPSGFDGFLPLLSDLPEGLSQEALDSGYGGTTGDRYKQLVEQIQTRIDACPGYANRL